MADDTVRALLVATLERKRGYLQEELQELARARDAVQMAENNCAKLQAQIADLERGQKALDRGYIALMGDTAI